MTSQSLENSSQATGGRGRVRLRYLVLVLLLVAVAAFAGVSRVRSSTIPTFSISSVVTDTSVTIQTQNFPANQNFVVTMGPFGTQGINGIVVATTNSGAGGSFSATYNIPPQLHGAYQVAVRMQTTHTNPFFAYNWFYNNTSGGGTGGIPDYEGIPTFTVTAVDVDKTATIQTSNFPPNQSFTVRMGPFGTQAVNGTVVGTLNSGTGGVLTATFNIPDALKGSYQIAIRAETSHTNPYFAYNWFYNNTTGTGGQPPPTTPPPTTPPPTTPPPTYTGFPTISICGVVRDTSVAIKMNNMPPNQTFTATMGPFGTQGIGGYVVGGGSFNSGVGGTLTANFNIPPQLAGSSRIAIRIQSAGSNPFFAYNWFYNNTATVSC